MRILLVSHRFPPAYTAGTEVYTAQLGTEMARRGHSVHVFTAHKDIGRSDFSVGTRVHAGLPVTELVNNLYHASFRATWDEPRVDRAFEAFVAREKPEVVHFQHLMYLSIGCVEIAARAGAAVVFTLHDYWLQCARFGQRLHADGTLCHTLDFARCGDCLSTFKFRQSPLAAAVGRGVARVHGATGVDLSGAVKRVGGALAPGRPGPGAGSAKAASELAREVEARTQAFRERVVPRVARFLAPSRFLRERFVEWGIPPERIAHLALGIDAPAFDPRLRERESGAGTPPFAVGFVGTLAPHKGAHVLLEAWARIPAPLRERGQLAVFGAPPSDPGYRRELERAAERAGARLAGAIERSRVPRELAALDLLVVPSLWFENAPLVIAEALAVRTPVLASDLGGMAELARPELGGEQFHLGDAGDLARKLAAFLERPALLTDLARRARPAPSFAEHALEVEAVYAAARGELPCRAP